MSKRRVVITGLGIISPLGCLLENVWQDLLAGKSGIRPFEQHDPLPLPVNFAGQVLDFDPAEYFPPKELRKLDPYVQYGAAAAAQAFAHAGFELNPARANRIGCAIGAGVGALTQIEANYTTAMTRGVERMSPNFVPSSLINAAGGYAAMQLGLKGPNFGVVSACASGTHNIGLSARLIACGDADVMLAGGAEKATTAIGVGGFYAMRALSQCRDNPAAASRPWDKNRDGFVISDGAGVVVLEALEHAQARGAEILAELTGFGMSADAYHPAKPDPAGAGAVQAMQSAITDAGCAVEDIDYINAHATSTPVGDAMEVAAIKKVFAEHAAKLAVSSTKSSTGHMLGAAGAVEAIFSVLALRDQVAPATLNCDQPEFDLDFVAHQPQARSIRRVLSNSFGFGGTNASLILERFTG